MDSVRAFVVVLAMIAFCGGCGDSGGPGTPVVTETPTPPAGSVVVTVESAGRKESLTVEVVATEAARQQGLMFRKELAASAGMLFLFKSNQSGGFWMKNTEIPLTIAYLDKDGVVVALRDGTPFDLKVLYPDATYRNVLEVNQGWFEEHGFGLGAVVHLPGGLPTPE